MSEEQTITITLVQMDCKLGQPKENFERAGALIAEAKRRGSDLVGAARAEHSL